MGKPMDGEELAATIWEHLLTRMKEIADKEGRSALAKTLGITPMAVGRYLDGARGKGVTLKDCVKYHLRMGGDLVGLMNAVGEEELAALLAFLLEHKEFVSDLLKLRSKNDGEAIDQMKKLVHMLAKK